MSERAIVAQADLWVAGLADGVEVVRYRLAHGENPEQGLRVRGWAPIAVRTVVGQEQPHELRLVYDVCPASARPEPWARTPTPRDVNLVISAGEEALPHQRVAAYAVVLSERGLLLSRFSDATNAEGEWGLCGGGVDPGEVPEETVHREIWEESGQRVELTGLATITTGHWVGRAPSGRLEDFHAVRLAYWAVCPDPTDPVVHDVGGTTEHSAWVPLSDLGSVVLVSSWRHVLPELLAAHQ